MAVADLQVDTVGLRRSQAAPRASANRGLAGFSAARAALLTGLVFATLAFGGVQPWAWAGLAAAVALAFAGWMWASLRVRALRIEWSPLLLPVAILVLAVAMQLQAHLTANSVATRDALLGLLTNLLIFFLACQLWNGRPAGSHQRFAFVVTLFAGALALFAILQFVARPDAIYGVVKPRWGGWVFGPYVNHNHYAGLMELLLPIAIAYAMTLRARRAPGGVLAAFAALVAFASLLLSGSRGGLVAAIAEGAVWALLLGKYQPEAGRRRRAAAALLGIAAASAFFFWLDPGNVRRRLGTVAELPRAPEATLGTRLVVARDALRIFARHPWLGAGLGSFATIYPQYRTFPSDLDWDHAHNDYAEALAETGVAGGLAMAAGLALFAALAFGDLRERLRRDQGWIQVGAAVGCSGLLLHSLVDFNLHIPANAAWFSLCAGIAVSRCRWRQK